MLQEFGEPGVYERAEAELGRSLTLHEVIALEFLSVRAPLVEVAAWVVENATIRPGFRELVEEHRPVVVSSGFHELIEPLLAREGVEVEVHANRLDARPEGWRVVFRDESACATCGEACKRSALPANGEIVYVGDGYSDRCAALAADRVFATDLLAEYLDERGVGYEPFTDLSDVAQALAR